MAQRLIALLIIAVSIAALSLYAFIGRSSTAFISYDSIVVDGEERTYRVAVPNSIEPPTLVIFAFHGLGDSTDSMAKYSRLDRWAAKKGALLIYPAGRNAMWDSIDIDADNLNANPDVRFFDALMQQIQGQYRIDSDSVYLFGMSNGASFAQVLAHARSSNIAGVVAHSGTRPKALHSARHKFPIRLVVGSDDHAARMVKSDHQYYLDFGHDSELTVIDDLGHAWSTSAVSAAWETLVNASPLQ